MAKQPVPPNNPFAKLLELGFEVPDTVTVSPQSTIGRRGTKPERNVKASKQTNKDKRGKQETKAKKRGGGTAGFKASLPKARRLAAAGTKKPLPYKESKAKRKSKKTKAATPNSSTNSSRPTLIIRIDPLIKALPRRSMQELQGQWLNCLRLLNDKSEGKRQAARRFREAILEEWERRCRIALSDPDYFDWPSTHAGAGDRSQRFDTWNQEGILKYMGYEVGKTRGLVDQSRKEILDAVFSAVLPPVNSPDYVRKWALPGTAPRLERLANELARFARNGKRNRSADYSSAIADWEADLKYLYRKYYVGKFNFGWPSIAS